PILWQARHGAQRSEAAEATAKNGDPVVVDEIQALQVFGRVLDVFQFRAAPITVDQFLISDAVAGRAADIRREDREPLAEHVLVEAAVGIAGAFLRLRPAVNREQRRIRSAAMLRLEQPRGDLTAIKRLETHQLRRDEFFVWYSG